MIYLLAEQSEYTLAYALVGGMILLGLLVVCLPRPRKVEELSPEEEEKLKRKKQKEKQAAKNKKAREKKKKKRNKARKKKKK